MPIGKAALSCSLALLACLAWPQPLGRALESLDAARGPAATREAVRSLLQQEDEEVLRLATEYLNEPSEAALQGLRQAMELRSLFEKTAESAPEAATAAKQIKESGLYTDPGVKESSNWFARLIERLKNLGSPDLPDAPIIPEVAGVGAWLITFVKVLLVGLATLFVFLAARHFRWKSRLRRQASAILDDDEPERTPDEWLDQAEGLAGQGRFREAVRCLYLACLLRFDEHGVARFYRHETNWEHLRRIEASTKLPPSLDFREPTRAFDRIWYGHHVRGIDDYEQFRSWYGTVLEALQERAA